MTAPYDWNPYISAAASRFGVPPALVSSVIGVESGGRPDALSGKNAGGLMQIIPSTYNELAKKHGLGPDRFNPADNVMGGTAYLRQLYDQYGNWPEALQAYNAGMGAMEKVKAGKIPLPTETANYVPSVLRRAGMQGTDMAIGQRRTAAGMTEDDLLELSRNGTMPRPGSGGLLDVPPEKNWLEGLGGIWNMGETPSKPPRPEGAVSDLPSQTERLDVTGRMNELMQGLLAPQTRGPSLTPGQYQLAGAGEAVGQLAGVTNRRVGIGEILGALGGGLTRGTLAGERAQTERLGSEFDRLGKFATIQGQQRTADLNEWNSVYDNQYKQALTQKALAPTADADRYKVVGKHVYDTQTKQFIASPEADGAGGPFEGNAAEVQGVNALIKAGKITPEQGATWLASKGGAGLNGSYDIFSPLQMSGNTTPSAPGTATAGPPASAQGPINLRPGVPTPNNEQSLAAGFANRLNESVKVFDTLENEGYVTPGLYDRAVDKVPVAGNYMTSGQFQQMEQAQREFINAQLRRESGAAISEGEFENARRQYFPQPGDSEAVLAQKRRSRNLAIANMAQSAGPAKLGFTPPKINEPGGEDPLGIR